MQDRKVDLLQAKARLEHETLLLPCAGTHVPACRPKQLYLHLSVSQLICCPEGGPAAHGEEWPRARVHLLHH